MTPCHIIHAIHFIRTRRPRSPHSALTCWDRLPGGLAQFGSAGRGSNEAHVSSPRMGWQRICIPVAPGGGKHRARGPGLASGFQNWAPTLAARSVFTQCTAAVLGPGRVRPQPQAERAWSRRRVDKGTRKHGVECEL